MASEVNLVLLRHGKPQQSDRLLGVTDPDLTELGFDQCDKVVSGHQFDRVVSSPRLRCQQFAQPFADASGLAYGVEDAFAELNFGDWDGQSLVELWQRQDGAFAAYWENPFVITPPSGESMQALTARVVQGLHQFQDCDGQRILVVTHGGVLRGLLAWLFNQSSGNAHLSKVVAGHASQLHLTLYFDDDGCLWPQLAGLIPTPELP